MNTSLILAQCLFILCIVVVPGASNASTPADKPLASTCVGEQLDLNTILAGKECQAGESPMAWPGTELDVEVVMSPVVEPGAQLTATLLIHNRGEAPVRFDLYSSCGPYFDAVVVDSQGKEVNQGECVTLRDCVRWGTVHLELAAGGTASFELEVAAVSWEFEQCVPTTKNALEPGRYEVRVRTPDREFGSATFEVVEAAPSP